MKAYKVSQFRSHLAEALATVKNEGMITVYNTKGDEFVITKKKKQESPFEKLQGINLNIGNEQIVSAIRESRKRH